MTAIFQTTFSNAFSWMKTYEFLLRFHWSCFLRSNQQYSSINSNNSLAPTRWQAIIWSNGDLLCWRIYASLWMSQLILFVVESSGMKTIWYLCNVYSIIWSNADFISIDPSGTISMKFISVKIPKFSIKKMHLQMLSAKKAVILLKPQCEWVNTLCPIGAIWWHRSGSILAQVTACCLMAPSHYTLTFHQWDYATLA